MPLKTTDPETASLLDALTEKEKAFFEYLSKVILDPVAQSFARQIEEQGGRLKQWVVLTPFLATTDRKYLRNYFEQYSKQTLKQMTIILYPNASKEVDRRGKAVDKACYEIESLMEEFPDLDIRYVEKPYQDPSFTSIGAIRKELWDGALLAGVQRSQEPKLEALEGDDAKMTFEEALEHADKSIAETVFFNADIDVVSISKGYMEEYAISILLNYFYAPKPYYESFTTRAVHGRVPELPNSSLVTAVFDFLISISQAGFEASMAIPSYVYATRGGLKEDAFTYEVAGFTDAKKTLHIGHITLRTDPRRFNALLHSRGINDLWGTPLDGQKSDFNEKDICREEKPAVDVSPERRDELILEKDEKSPFSGYLARSAFHHLVPSSTQGYAEIYRKLMDLPAGDEKEKHYAEWEHAFTYAFGKKKLALMKLLSMGGFGQMDELSKKIDLDFEKEMEREREFFWSEPAEEEAEVASTEVASA